MAKDFYAILGVNRSASESEIKSAYRKLSKELHPDKHKGDKEKEAKFKEVNEAYEVLSNKEKRARYDQFGSDGAQFGGGGFQGDFSNFDFSQFGGGFGDMFESFFGGQRGGRRQRDRRGSDIEIGITIPFVISVSGEERDISFETLIVCDTCNGNGAAPGAKLDTCDECKGTGQITRTTQSIFGMMQQTVVCPKCHGSGKVPTDVCKKCKGDGRVRGTKTVKVNIPAGIDDGQSLRLRGEGSAGEHGAEAGDLYVRIRVQSDNRFTRDGDDIRSELMISVTDAILGSEKEVETVHGSVTLKIPAGTQPNTVMRIKGKGMPVLNTHRHGDQYVTVMVEIPSKLSRSQRKIIEELRKESSE